LFWKRNTYKQSEKIKKGHLKVDTQKPKKWMKISNKFNCKFVTAHVLMLLSLLKILSFTTSHYVTGMQLVINYNYFAHVYNYKFGIVLFLGHTVVCVINMQLNVYNMDTCHKINGLNLYIFQLLYLIYLHRLYIIVLCTSSIKVNPMLT